ncbi:alpha/beta fold hydrolase [Halorubrum vacuolatum]|uniref:Pimeloyl-ACP methyl ester carboxylesterase n=1 Tax=Halorubrum vacuolatum TaxID=63740 RepID=A0A238VVF4_HALVU|nr:alpha/beta hydrolase [Halorubrum vacuolatum]SNR37813.1 Pimeloyl-ACP methyl ester carboxylesterase [Halorubrum vacuolatum]
MNRTSHHGRETAYRRFDRGGDGPPICFIHGSGGTGDVWRAQTRLADRFPVVTLDLSGHGASDDVDAEPGSETLGVYADDVLAVVEAATNSGERPVLCGSSLGGAVALWVALERDVDLAGLVLAGTGAKLPVLRDLLDWLANDFDRAIEFLHGEDRLFHDGSSAYVDRSAATMRECGRAVVERDFRSCNRFDVRDRLPAVEPRTLAVVGEHDRLTPPSYHDFLAESIPRCERATVEDAAHLAMMETPVAFNAALASFLDRLG